MYSVTGDLGVKERVLKALGGEFLASCKIAYTTSQTIQPGDGNLPGSDATDALEQWGEQSTNVVVMSEFVRHSCERGPSERHTVKERIARRK